MSELLLLVIATSTLTLVIYDNMHRKKQFKASNKPKTTKPKPKQTNASNTNYSKLYD